MAISFNRIIPKPTYNLHMLDRESSYVWEVKDFKITSEPNFKFITTNIISAPDKNIIELDIVPKRNSKQSNKLTRTVLVEKIGYEIITIEEDPITIWSFQELNQELTINNFINTRDFLLTDSINGRNWVLTECLLIDSQMWRMSNWLYSDDSQDNLINRKITIKPKAILQYQ